MSRCPAGGGQRWGIAAAAGVVVAAAYLAAAGLSFRTGLEPAVPVLDGLQPPAPYRWVKPPPDRVNDNKRPSGATATIPLTSFGSSGSVTTPDGQAQLLSDTNSIPVQPGQTSIKVSIDPQDPAAVGPPPPAGYHYDSNAYMFAAVYQPSGQTPPTMTVTVVLSFATSADHIFEWNGSGWDALPATPAGQNQLFAPATKLGILVAAGTGTGGGPVKQQSPVVAVVIVLGVFGVIAVVLVVALLGRRRAGAGSGSRR